MSVERAVREKQAYRNRLREFLSIAAVMTTDEVEIALGRLADLLGTADGEHAELEIRAKGTALKVYFDLRQSAILTQDHARRTTLEAERKRQQGRDMPTFQRALEIQSQAIEKQKQEEERRRPKKSWFARLITPVSGPTFSEAYAEAERELLREVDNRTTEAFLLHHLTSFELVPAGMSEPEVTPEQVKLLATESA